MRRIMQVIGIFGNKGDALPAVGALYEIGDGDTEIGCQNQRPLDDDVRHDHVQQVATTSVAAAIYAAVDDDEIGSRYRDSVETGSSVVSVATIERDEPQVSNLFSGRSSESGSLRSATGRSE